MDTEISEWADLEDEGTLVSATDRASGAEAGVLEYFWLDDDTIQFKFIQVAPDYRRRRVGTALLRYLNLCHPHARINPGTRNFAGSAFMEHILSSEQDKVASNGVLNVPLSRMNHWPGFDLKNAQRLAGVAS